MNDVPSNPRIWVPAISVAIANLVVELSYLVASCSTGDEGKSGFPVHWPKGMQGSAITDGGWGPGFKDPFYSQHFFKMNAERDAAKRMTMAEEYFDHVSEGMLQPCVIEMPYHPYNPKLIAEWNMHQSMNGNLSGANSFETIVLK